MNWNEIPRYRLASLPTKIDHLDRLSKDLNGPNIYLKRDDETGLAFGGNKVRKLEFIIADALQKKADVIITSGGVQTNHGRLTVAAAVKTGIKPVLVLTNNEPAEYEGNLLLDKLLGAEIHFVYPADENLTNEEAHKKARIMGEEKVKELKEQYEKEGKTVYIVPRGGRSIPGTIGYCLATLEIYQQMIESQNNMDYIVTSVGSSSTLGGLIIGNKLFNTNTKIIGISVSRNAGDIKKLVLEQAESFIKHFNLNISVSEEDIIVFDSYIGNGYAIPTEKGIQAIKTLSSKESVFLDQTYTGKGMSGLIDLIERGYFKKEDNVLFIHTGGSPALFSLEANKFM
jgi:D-cysteine desulfhydrase family pyridoxal phosphate-dependent enzyme